MNANPDLKIIDFPSGLREITGSALSDCPKLRYTDKFHQTSLVSVGSLAFAGSFNMNEAQIEKFQLPGSLKKFSLYAFMNMGAGSPPSGQYRIVEVSFGGPGDPSEFTLGSVSGSAAIFQQNPMNNTPPSDEGAHSNTPIKCFTFYKETGATSPTLDEFKEFVRSGRCLGDNETLDIAVVETTKE